MELEESARPPERKGVPVGNGRLSREDWLEAGFEALHDVGPHGIRVTRPARRLGVELQFGS